VEHNKASENCFIAAMTSGDVVMGSEWLIPYCVVALQRKDPHAPSANDYCFFFSIPGLRRRAAVVSDRGTVIVPVPAEIRST
jgi:hypothetical protein